MDVSSRAKVVANENEMIFGATSAVFGVRPEDRHILYVLTDGGYSKPMRGDFPVIIALEID